MSPVKYSKSIDMKILRSILFYVLFFMVVFFLGILIAGFVDAGKGQMLAGGAIVLSYGVSGAILGLITAFLVALLYKPKAQSVILVNKIMVALLLCLWLFFYLKYKKREASKKEQIGCVIKSSYGFMNVYGTVIIIY